MECKCGYSFAEKALQDFPREFESYGIVADADYQRFLKSELKLIQQRRGSKQYYKAFGKSAELMGSLLECPDCGRLLLLRPGAACKEFYMLESKVP